MITIFFRKQKSHEIKLQTYKTSTTAKLQYIMIMIFKNKNTVVCVTDDSGESQNRNTVEQIKDETDRCTPGLQYFINFSNSNHAKRNHLIDIIQFQY